MKLLDIVTRNKDVTSDLSLALCAVVDVYGPFVRVTRFLDSRNFIGPFVYREVTALKVFAQTVLQSKVCPNELPNVRAVLSKVAGISTFRSPTEYWLQFILPAVRPGLEYYWKLFVNLDSDIEFDEDPSPVCFREFVDLFRFVRLFEPKQGLAMLSAPNFSIDEWKAIALPSISGALWEQCASVAGLSALTKLYIDTFAHNDSLEFDAVSLLLFWQDKANILCAGPWAEAAQVFVLARPSSAYAESLFSLYQWCVSDFMMRSHEDTQELRVQLNQERVSNRNL